MPFRLNIARNCMERQAHTDARNLPTPGCCGLGNARDSKKCTCLNNEFNAKLNVSKGKIPNSAVSI